MNDKVKFTKGPEHYGPGDTRVYFHVPRSISWIKLHDLIINKWGNSTSADKVLVIPIEYAGTHYLKVVNTEDVIHPLPVLIKNAHKLDTHEKTCARFRGIRMSDDIIEQIQEITGSKFSNIHTGYPEIWCTSFEATKIAKVIRETEDYQSMPEAGMIMLG